MNKVWITAVSLILAVFAMSAWSAKLSLNNQANYLFIQQAKMGELIATTNQGAYQLVLRGVHPYVMYFADRPLREAGLISTQEFYQQWARMDGFNKDAPNVGLVGVKLHNGNGKRQDSPIALTLSNPQYNAKKNTVIYSAVVLSTGKATLPKQLAFATPVLFFDSGFDPHHCSTPGCLG